MVTALTWMLKILLLENLDISPGPDLSIHMLEEPRDGRQVSAALIPSPLSLWDNVPPVTVMGATSMED